jgi:Cof subfamily protein (haloacid dehalogenase superfamily)
MSTDCARTPRTPPKPGQIQLIALDLDGTLLRSDNTIGARTVNALRAAQGCGVRIALVSGRMNAAMEPTTDQLGLDTHLISCHGAAAAGLRAEGRRPLFELPLPMPVALRAVALAREHGVHVNCFESNAIHTPFSPDLRRFTEFYQRKMGTALPFVTEPCETIATAPLKIGFIMEKAACPKFESELRLAVGCEMNIWGSAGAKAGGLAQLECVSDRVNKAVGLQGLCAALGIELSSVLAVGDGDNDVPMIDCAGWGVGVANATAGVRRAACAITDNDHNHDAVAEAVERWVLNVAGAGAPVAIASPLSDSWAATDASCPLIG